MAGEVFGVHPPAWSLLAVLFLVGWTVSVPALPVVTVTHDDTLITQSCEIVVPPGTVIADANTNGVLVIAGDNLTVRFGSHSELRGAAPGVPWDRLRGIGIRIDGRRGVRLVGARVHGFFNGLVATRADGLVVESGDFSDNYRQRLRSTPEAEDAGDWLFPHHNDEVKWRDEYGGAICLEESVGVTVRNVRVRRGQNGILLDRVREARIYDNDCSFLSGWGLALWRSSGNVITRNAFDFCVRGHVEGVYNRGQDSAGILCFEQSNDNVIAENSATHGGDGFFGFAGHEALGERWLDAERERLRKETGKDDVKALVRVSPEVAADFSARGCNRNLILGNDFSYAAAHGLELTFSEANVIARNRLVENAICGVWGGYSSGLVVAENEFTGNGGMAYGLERGAINMEHASGNRVVGNQFRNNKCAVHLWWDNDGDLLRLPGVAGNDFGASSNVIAKNSFVIDRDAPFRNLRTRDPLVILQLRDDGRGNVRDTVYTANRVSLTATNAVEFLVAPGIVLSTNGPVPAVRIPRPQLLGRTRPVGARAALRGRDRILLDEWGPWDHEGPMVRSRRSGGDGMRFEVFGVTEMPTVEVRGPNLSSRVHPTAGGAWEVGLVASEGVTPYEVRITAPGLERTFTGTLVRARWSVVFFPWSVDIDPRKDRAGWRRLAEGDGAVSAEVSVLDFPYGGGGPRNLGLAGVASERLPGSEHFGMVARARLNLPAGRWRLATWSDDGVSVSINGTIVLENWTWHGPTRDESVFEQKQSGPAEFVVEHFEIDGFATLRFELEPVGP